MRERGLQEAEAARQATGLIGAGTVAAILGIRVHEVPMLVRRGPFPVPVAVIGGARAWWAADVLSHDRGDPVAQRIENEMQDQVLSSSGLGALLGRSSGSIIAALHQHRTTVPPPDGRMSERHYRLRSSVVDWLSERAAKRSPGSG